MPDYELLKDFQFRRMSEPERIVKLNDVATGLLEMFCLCRETDESLAVLTWPQKVENIAIFHAFAQLRQIIICGEERVCDTEKANCQPLLTYFWPWLNTTESNQKRILVDRIILGEKNFQLVLRNLNDTSGVAYAFHSALNCIRDLDPSKKFGGVRGHRSILQHHPELLHPTLFEITPQAALHLGNQKLFPLDKLGFLKRVEKYARQCSALADQRLSDIEKAPFFMVGIPISFSMKDFRHSAIFAARRPDVVLVDLTNTDSRFYKKWQKPVKELLTCLLGTFTGKVGGPPLVLAVTDKPFIFNQMSYEFLANYEEQRLGKKKISRYAFVNVAQGLFDERSKVRQGSIVPTFSVASIADDMADVFVSQQQLKNKVREMGSEELAEAIDKLSHAMRNIINMPGGMDDYMEFLQEYCEETGANDQEVVLKPWSRLSKVKEFVERGDADTERARADEYLEKCRSILEGLKTSTPVQLRLQMILEKLKSRQINVAFIFSNRQMCAFADWMYREKEEVDANPEADDVNRIVFFNIKQSVDLSRTVLTHYDTVYFVLPYQKEISQILAQHEIPKNICFVCDGGTVQSFLRYFDILEKLPGLDLVKPRIKALSEALMVSAGNRISLLGDLDEVELMASAMSFNLREDGLDQYAGHPVLIKTEEGYSIKASEGTEVLRYTEDNDLQPFSKVTVAKLQDGDRFFFMTNDFIDNVRDKLNITAEATKTLHDYHALILEKKKQIPGTSLKGNAEYLQKQIRDISKTTVPHEVDNLDNIKRWINVEKLLDMPREVVRPQAPKTMKVFRIFMKALGVGEVETDWYWATAIQSTRKVRVRAGFDRARLFYRLLIDPSSVENLFKGDKGDLKNIIDIACRSVFTVQAIIKEHEDANPEY